MRRLLLFFIPFLLLQGCGEGSKHVIKIGWDPNWRPLDFGAQNSYVNGYTEELLIEISSHSDLRFEKITANWDSLFSGLKQKQYDAILSSLPPYSFNLAEYDFSESILDIGPVLIVPATSSYSKLNEMNGRFIGTLGAPSIELLQQENITIQQFDSIPTLLEATLRGNIDAAVLDKLPAVSYVSDLFSGQLKVILPPLNNTGLRLIILKGKNATLLREFNQKLAALKKKKQVRSLLEKWQVG